MDNYDYVAHITFISRYGRRIPLHVVFREVQPPFCFTSFRVTVPKETTFTFEDFIVNQYVDVFPPKLYLFEHSTDVELSELPAKLNRVYDKKDYQTIIAAVDCETFLYLKDHLPNVILLESPSVSEDLTLAAVLNKYYRDRKWRGDT